MYSDPLDSLREVLIHWLKAKLHTWDAVITALKSPIVGEKNVAAQLESKYCPELQDMIDESNNPTKAEKSEGTLSFHD